MTEEVSNQEIKTFKLSIAKNFLEFVILSFLSIFVALFIIEISLRIYQYLGEKQFLGLRPSRITLTWIEDPDIGKVILKPNSSGFMVTPSKEYFNFIRVNKEGFYDESHELKKPENTYRILFLGDSFVASLQTPLNKTFFKQLETNLNQKNLEKKIEVIAIGMGDTGTAQQYIALKKIGLKYNPDLVVSMFLTANDFKNNSPILQKDPYRPYFVLDESGNLKLLPHPQSSKKRNSVVKNWFKNLRIVEFALQIRQKFLEYRANHKVDYPIDYHVYDNNYNKDYSDSLEVTKKLILAEKNIVEEAGGKYILVTLANNEQVNNLVWGGLKISYPNMAKADLDQQKPDKELKKFCDDQKLDCLQMLPTFLDFAKNHPNLSTHYHLDGHFNQLGTDIATKFLVDNLKNNL